MSKRPQILYEMSVADARRVALALIEAAVGADREGLALIELDEVIMMVAPGVRRTDVDQE